MKVARPVQEGAAGKGPEHSGTSPTAYFTKGSGPVQQMLLDAFEEHVLAEPDAVHNLPLLLGVSASNELTNAKIENAFWDRLTIRKQVNYPTRDEDWEALVTSVHGTLPIATRLDPDEVMLVQGLVELRAGQIPVEVRRRMVRIKSQIVSKGIPISPRRFIAWSRVATARSLLLGEQQVTAKAIAVGEHMLWVSEDDIATVRDIVRSLSDPQRGILRAVEADIENIVASLNGPNAELSDLVQWQKSMSKHEAALKKVTDPQHQPAKEELIQRIRDASAMLVSRSAEVMEQKAARSAA